MEEKRIKRRSYVGQGNPHFGKPHTQEVRDRISETQKARYKTLREILNRTLDKENLKEIIEECLRKNRVGQ